MSLKPSASAASSKGLDLELYPDLAAAGGLHAAVEQVSVELGLDQVEIWSGEEPSKAAAAGSATNREPLSIYLGSLERWFIVSGWSRGVELVRGATKDLHEVVKAAAAWSAGGSLHDLRELCPFLTFGELAEAHERGPAVAVAVKWRLLREELRDDIPFPAVRDLVEAAYAEPKLRALYPFTSHWSLHFTTCTGYPFTWVVPFIDPLRDGRFRVCGPSRGTVIGEVDTAAEAVALVVSHLPAQIGPAVAGTALDLAGR
jgi:hypothetical protein